MYNILDGYKQRGNTVRYRGKLKKIYVSGAKGDIDIQDTTQDTADIVLGSITYRQFLQTLNKRQRTLCKRLLDTNNRHSIAKQNTKLIQMLQTKAIQFFGCKPSAQFKKVLI
jgi:hypothetical protein